MLNRRIAVLLASSLSMLQMLPGFAQTVPQDMNLGSSRPSVMSSNVGPTVITVGGNKQTVAPGTLVTPAQSVAVGQVARTGAQSLILSSAGAATSGHFFVGGEQLSGLSIPQGVTAFNSVAGVSALNISGSFVNAGSWYSFTANSGMSAVINAANVLNQQGALISTTVPSSFLSITGAVKPLNLNINALENITNAGTIASSGSLSMSAGGSITNASTSAGSTAQMTAATGINFQTNNLINSGLVSTTSGDINLTAPTGSIVVNNSGGTLQALAGALNVRNALFTEKADFDLIGGDVLSKVINVYSGCGNVDINAHDISGIVNITADVAHVSASTPSLQLGKISLTGDPTFYNLNGDVLISNDLIFAGEPLAIVASGNIRTTASNISIDTSSGTDAGPITMIAGVNFTIDTLQPAGQIGPDTSTQIVIVGPSVSGGAIDLTGGGTNNIKNFDAIGTAQGGGTISLVAVAGANANTGRVIVPSTVPIQTGGGSSNGDVLVLAGASGGESIQIGGVTTNLAAPAGTGSITLRTSTPLFEGPLTIDANGAITSGKFNAGATQAGSIKIGALVTEQAPVTIVAGNKVTITGNITTFGSDGSSNGSIGIFAGGDIVSGGGGSPQISSAGLNSGNSGSPITMAAGAAIDASFTDIDSFRVIGASGSGGTIDLTGAGSTNVTALSAAGFGGPTDSGAAITLVAMPGYALGSGRVVTAAPLNINTTSGGIGKSGDIMVLAGAASGNAATLGKLNTLGTTGGSGNVTVVSAKPAEGAVFYDDGKIATGSFQPGALQKSSVITGNITGNSSTVTVQSGADLTVGIINNRSTLGSSNEVNLSAPGVMTLAALIDVGSTNTTASSAGTIKLSAGSYVTAGPTVLNAFGEAGSTPGHAGTISIVSTDASKALAVGTSNDFIIGAASQEPGGNGGKLVLSAAGDLGIDPAGIVLAPNTNGIGGTLIASAGTKGTGNLVIANDLDLSGNGTGGGGQISLTMASTAPFVIGTAGSNSSFNLIANGEFGGSISVTNTTGGIKFDGISGVNLSASSTGAGANGSIALVSSKGNFIGTAGTINANGGPCPCIPAIQISALAFDLTGMIQLNAFSNVNGGGQIVLTSTAAGKSAFNGGTINIGTVAGQTGGFAIDAHGNTGGGSLFVSSGANINVNPTGVNLTTVSGSGGSLSLSAGNTSTGNVFVSGGALNLAAGTTSGGALSINTKSTTPFNVDTTATVNGLAATVDVSGVDGGVISITNLAGGIRVNPANLNFSNAGGTGATIKLDGAGDVLVTAGLDVSGSPAGAITISSSSSKPFIIGVTTPASLNGIAGDIVANSSNQAGSISVTNLKGGIIVQNNAIDVSGASALAAGAITLKAPLSTVFVDGDLSASNAFKGGTINILTNSSKPFTIDPAATANGVKGAIKADGTTIGGSISITNLGGSIIQNSNSTALSVDATPGNAGGFFTLNAAKGAVLIKQTIGLNVSSTTGNGGAIEIFSNSAKPFTVNGTAPVDNGVMTLKADAIGNAGTIKITNNGTGGISLTSATTNVTASTTGTGRGGNLIFTTKGGMSITGGISALGGFGTIRLQAASYTLNSPVLISTNGANGFGGGAISIYSTGSGKNIEIGGNLGQFELQAKADAASGNGGIITVSSAGNLTVDPLAVDASAPAGVYGTLNFTGKNVLVNGTITAPGGNVNIVSNNSKPFIVAALPVGTLNGISGSINTAGSAGGLVGIRNNGTGGILINNPTFLNVQNTNPALDAGTIDLEAPAGTITISTATNNTLSASAIAGTGKGGNIMINAKVIAVTGTSNLSLTADSFSGTGGFVSINQTAAKTPLTIGLAAGQILPAAEGSSIALKGAINLVSASGILVNTTVGGLSQAVDLSLTTSGKSTIMTGATGLIVGDTITLNTGTGAIGASNNTNPADIIGSVGALNLQTQANTVKVTSAGGNVFIFNNSSGAIQGSQKAIKGTQVFTFGFNGDADINSISAPNGQVNLVAINGSNGSIAGPASSALNSATANLFTDGTGTIAGTNFGSWTTSGGINLTTEGGDIGDPITAFTITTPALSITGAANSYIESRGNLVLTLNNPTGIYEIENTGTVTIPADPNQTAPTAVQVDSLKLTTVLNGSIILKNGITANTSLDLYAGGYGSIVRVGKFTTLDAPTASLKSDFGNIGTSGAALAKPTNISNTLSTNVTDLTVNTGGTGIVDIFNFDNGDLNLNGVKAGGSIKIITNGTLNINGNLSSQHGNVTLLASNDIMIASVVKIEADSGINITNGNDVNGIINFGANSSVYANGSISVTTGFVFDKTSTVPPANVIVVGPTGNVTFDPPGSVTASAPDNLIEVSAKTSVRFNNAKSINPINFDGGVSFSSNPIRTSISSLDLTDKTIFGALAFDQAFNPGSGITGDLFGKGTLIFDNTVDLSNVSAINIPSKITVSFVGFTSANPIGININANSSFKSAKIDGKLNFVSDGTTPSGGLVTITSSVPGTVTSIAKSGGFSSDGDLIFVSGGNASIAGTMGAAGNLVLLGVAGNNAAKTSFAGLSSGSLSLSGKITSGGPNLLMLSSGGINQTGGLLKGDNLLMAVLSGNTIIEKSGQIQANSLSLGGGTGNISIGLTGKNALLVSKLSIFNPFLFRSANVSIKNSQAMELFDTLVGGALSIEAPSITVKNFPATAGSVKVTTNALNMPDFVSGISANDDFAGTITISSPKTGSKNLSITGPTVVPFQETLLAKTGVTITSAGDLSITGAGPQLAIKNSSGLVNVSSSGALTLSNTSIVSGSASDPGTVFPRDFTPGSIKITTTGKSAMLIEASTLRSNASDLTVTAKSAMFLSGTSFTANTFQAQGGNLRILAAGSISEKQFLLPSNTFIATALGTGLANTSGGGIEMSAGSTTSKLSTAFLSLPGTRPFGSVSDSSNMFFGKVLGLSGALLTTLGTGGNIDLTFAGPGVVSINNGAPILLNSSSKTGTIKLLSPIFDVTGFTPMGYEESIPAGSGSRSEDEIVVDSADGLEMLEGQNILELARSVR